MSWISANYVLQEVLQDFWQLRNNIGKGKSWKTSQKRLFLFWTLKNNSKEQHKYERIFHKEGDIKHILKCYLKFLDKCNHHEKSSTGLAHMGL